MAQITQAGSLNTTALSVPDLYVQIVPPQQLILNGVSSNIIGIVGTASWGPVNQAVVFGSIAELATTYSTTGTYPVLLTALYTGSLGNQVGVDLEPGSRAGSWRLVLSLPGNVPEVFDNIDATAGVATFWSNLVAAVNGGVGALRGPSQLVVASVGTGLAIAPSVVTSQTLLAGTDGATNVTAESLVGADGIPRSGMYSLRGRTLTITRPGRVRSPSACPRVFT